MGKGCQEIRLRENTDYSVDFLHNMIILKIDKTNVTCLNWRQGISVTDGTKEGPTLVLEMLQF